MKKRIALLFGGEGCEREISKRSAAAIYPFIKRDDLEVFPIYLDSEGKAFSLPADVRLTDDAFLIDEEALTRVAFTYRGFIKGGEYLKLDLVFPLLHGDYGEDGVIQGLLTAFGMNFVGADNFAGAIAGIVTGAAVDILWLAFLGSFGLYEIIPGCVLGTVAAVVATLLTKAPSKEVTEVFDKVAKGEIE